MAGRVWRLVVEMGEHGLDTARFIRNGDAAGAEPMINPMLHASSNFWLNYHLSNRMRLSVVPIKPPFMQDVVTTIDIHALKAERGC